MKKKIKIPIYHWELIIYYNIEDLLAVEKEYWFPERSTDWYWAITFTDHKNWYTRYVMAFRKWTNQWEIAHECLHCLRYMYVDRGIQLETNENDEHQCYLLGWLVNKVNSLIDKK